VGFHLYVSVCVCEFVSEQALLVSMHMCGLVKNNAKPHTKHQNLRNFISYMWDFGFITQIHTHTHIQTIIITTIQVMKLNPTDFQKPNFGTS
jgi:hypothetical protein